MLDYLLSQNLTTVYYRPALTPLLFREISKSYGASLMIKAEMVWDELRVAVGWLPWHQVG